MAASYISIVTKTPLSQFAALVSAARGGLMSVTLVSPWIVKNPNEEFPPLATVLMAVGATGARARVLTRPPSQPGHEAALRLCRSTKGVEVFTLPTLHAKLFLFESRHMKGALVGSPNFTPSGNERNRELALELRSSRDSDISAELIRDLQLYSQDLMCDDDATLLAPE